MDRQALAQSCIDSAQSLAQEGRLAEALWRLNRGLKRVGPLPGLYSHRARVHFHRRQYEASLMDMERAIRLSPRDPDLYVQRSDLLAQINRGDEARRDLERSLRLSPGNEWLRFARLRLLLGSGQKETARRDIADLVRGGSPATALEAVFYRGFLDLKTGRVSSAEKNFRHVMEHSAPESGLSQRARFYLLAARFRGRAFKRDYFGPAAPRTSAKKLYLCGLGLFPPYTATLEALDVLGRCDLLINNVSGSETREFLSIFGAEVMPATYDNKRDDYHWARRIIEEVIRGRNVAFVTRGHPLVFGGLGQMLVSQCEGVGVGHETLAAVSSIDVLLSATGRHGGAGVDGVQVYDYRTLAARAVVNPRHPLLVYFYKPLGGAEVPAMGRVLRRFYPPSHACRMFGPKYDTEPVDLRLDEIAKRFAAIHSSLILFVPGLGESSGHG